MKIIIIFMKIFIFFGFFLIWFRTLYRWILRYKYKIKAPGIDLMEVVEIGGIKHVLYFRGEKIENPVILFIHGGPGSPMMPMLHGFQYELETDFTFVQWDQQNAGKTFFLNDPEAVLESMNFERALKDAYEITQYIKQKLGKDKIIILGHSWGSVLGTALVQAYPQQFSAYIGIGQITNMKENEIVGYHKVLEVARIQSNKKDIVALEALAPYLLSEEAGKYFRKIRKYLNKYRLAEDFSFRLAMLVLISPYYSLGDLLKYYFKVNISHYQKPLVRFLKGLDIRNFGTSYEIPVFYIMGERDYQTPYPLAKDFFEEISAPNKEFFSIPDASHIPMLDDKEEFNRIMREIIRARTF